MGPVGVGLALADGPVDEVDVNVDVVDVFVETEDDVAAIVVLENIPVLVANMDELEVTLELTGFSVYTFKRLGPPQYSEELPEHVYYESVTNPGV